MSTAEPARFMTIPDVAQELNTSTSQIRALIWVSSEPSTCGEPRFSRGAAMASRVDRLSSVAQFP
ncbi:hypothetical protein [Arthrobacter sp. H20]|uniref:hypothetical protein n=1 Tax=Arthrobacter sp. H20 TaxID=1267981 RepID=UPI0004BC890D|nr:hypothetical protein [Arthrobacter sp. H20]